MSLSPALVKKLSKIYTPDTLLDFSWHGKDITIKTDEGGNAILLFIGRRLENGKIRGERYARRLLRDATGAVIKDHWDAKGRSE